MSKLLYCIPSLYNPGGMERVLTEKINYLVDELNYEVIVITTDQQSKPIYFTLSQKVRVINLDINFNEIFNDSLINKLINTWKKNRLYKTQLQEIITSNRVDICISTGGKELEFFSKMKVNCIKILEYHFAKNFRKQFLIARNPSLKNKIIGELRVRQLTKQTKKLDKVVVLTKRDEEEWLKTNCNVTQIYNFSSSNSTKVSKLNSNTAIAVGRLDAQKGFDLLIEAWNLNKIKLKNWKLNIFGQGEWFGILSEKIRNYNLEDNIFLMGVSNNLEMEFENSSIFLFSSRYEGFGLVLLEAMQKGLPSVSFDCPHGPSELLINNSGFLVPPNELSRFSNYIIELSENYELRKEMGGVAFEESKKFSKVNIMNRWNQLFKDLL